MSQDTVRVPNSSSSPAGVVHAPSSKAALVLGALGVVYGDIGTSPLYTLRACLTGLSVHTDLEPAHLLGVLSILFWMLMVVVSFKYVMLVLRADNRGEGGTLALLELAVRGREGRMRWVLIVLGIFGAALFYGDSMITPAISVLSALEGIGIVSHQLDEWVVPLALLVLVGLFVIQSHGTGLMGKLFGPVMALWFGTLALLGGWQVWQTPEVLSALNPMWACASSLNSPDQLRAAGRRGAGADRRRGAVRRHGPLRPSRHPPRLVQHGDAGADAVLLRPGRAAAARSRGDPQSLLPDGARLGPGAAGGAGHRGHRGGVAGGDLGSLLGDAPGRAAGFLAAHADPAHLGGRERPDLPAAGQRAAAVRGAGAGAGVPQFRQPRRRLRLRRDRHHADYLGAGLRRAAARQHRRQADAVAGGVGPPAAVRRAAVLGQRVQDPRRWLAAAGGGDRGVHADDDLASRPPPAVRNAAARPPAAQGIHGAAGGIPTVARARHRHFHDHELRQRAAGAAAQPQAQQGAARPCCS